MTFESLRYIFLSLGLMLIILFILTYPTSLIKKYTLDIAYIHIIAHFLSWAALFISYYILLKIKSKFNL